MFTYLVYAYISAFLDLIPPLREFEDQLFDMETKLSKLPQNSVEYIIMERRTRALQYYFEPMRLEFYDDMMMLTYLCFAVLFFAI